MASILVVEDIPSILGLAKMRLELAGHTVFSAHDGQSGLDRALELMPDLILMDMYMPGTSGLDAVQSLRQLGYAGIVIAFTALASIKDGLSLEFQAACDGVIGKPFPADFEEQVAAFIPACSA